MNGTVRYKVNGRYMNGSEVVAYNLVSNTGESIRVNREKAILMISRGLIENMRIQYCNDGVIIRGNKINLNTLPIFDVNKDNFRGPKDTKTKRAEYLIVKRMMFKTSCIGYVLLDGNKREIKLNRQRVIDLASKGLVENAGVGKYQSKEDGTSRLGLRGLGCDLSKLPVVLVNKDGSLVDTSNDKQSVTVRASQVKKPGILYNAINGSKHTVKAGDFLVCTPDGKLVVMDALKARDHLQKVNKSSVIGDEYLSNIDKYSFEALGSTKVSMEARVITRWPIVEISREPVKA